MFRFARRAPTPSRWSRARPGRSSAPRSGSARSPPCTRAPIYLHLGESYRVLALDLDARAALVERFTSDYYTQAKKETTTAIEGVELGGRRLGLDVFWGRVTVTEQVVGYQKRAIRDSATLDLVALDLPETTFETEAVWYLPGPEPLDGLEAMPRLLGSLHAAEHAMIALLPLWAMCDRWDIGGLSTNLHFQTGRPTIFVYDGAPGRRRDHAPRLRPVRGLGRGHGADARGLPVRARLPLLRPVPKCGNLNEPLDKAGAHAARPDAHGAVAAPVDFSTPRSS